ncbi:MAG TPA: hypothetical protein PK402_14825, partial [Tepidisphaeraceae bacterium]|nr:hypothetical protein [Tepidisphaeraceae bacterium]
MSATVRDVDGKTVFQKTGGWTWNSDGVANQTSSMIELPITDPGWYRVDFTLTSGSRVVSEVSTNVVRFAESNSLTHPDRRFGFVATDLPLSTWSYLPETLESLAAGRVKLSVWDEHTAIESTTDAPAFDRVLDAFERRGITIIGCLRALPPSIADSLGGSEFERALNQNSTSWKNQLAYLVSRHAGHITSWQLLDDSSAERIAREPLLQKLHDQMHRELTTLLEAPDLALPWPAWAELEQVSGQSIALSVPDSILPSQLPLYINSLKQSDAQRQIALQLKPIDEKEYGLAAQRRDLAQRIVYALAAGAERIELPLPLEGKRIDGELKLDPSPLAPT